MKCLSIQQPWAAIIAHGIKDVENRTDRKLVPPQRILIHVGAKARGSLDELPEAYYFPVEFAEQIGLITPESADIKSAIIGYVDVVDIVTDSKSLWAQYSPEGEKPMQHYILENAKLFKKPILGVKGRLGVWDIPEIDENNLPETVDLPKVERNGNTLIIPCGSELWAEVSTWFHEYPEYDDFEFSLTLTDANLDILAPEAEGEEIDLPKTIIFKSKHGAQIEVKVEDAYTEELTLDDSGEPIFYEDEAGNEYVATEVHYTVKRK